MESPHQEHFTSTVESSSVDIKPSSISFISSLVSEVQSTLKDPSNRNIVNAQFLQSPMESVSSINYRSFSVPSTNLTPEESESRVNFNKTTLLVCAAVAGFLLLVIMLISILIFIIVCLKRKHSIQERNKQLDLTNPSYDSGMQMLLVNSRKLQNC